MSLHGQAGVGIQPKHLTLANALEQGRWLLARGTEPALYINREYLRVLLEAAECMHAQEQREWLAP